MDYRITGAIDHYRSTTSVNEIYHEIGLLASDTTNHVGRPGYPP